MHVRPVYLRQRVRTRRVGNVLQPFRRRQLDAAGDHALVWALHDVLPARLRAAILLGAFVGLRVAEACGLRVADAGAAAARVGQDNARHVRAPVARPGRIHTSGRERRAGRAGGESCGFCAD
jgi:integrase